MHETYKHSINSTINYLLKHINNLGHIFNSAENRFIYTKTRAGVCKTLCLKHLLVPKYGLAVL